MQQPRLDKTCLNRNVWRFSKPASRNETSLKYRFSPEPVILHRADTAPRGCDSALLTRRWAGQTGGGRLAATLVLAGKRPTLRPGDSQTRACAHTRSHKQTPSSRLSGRERMRACVCVKTALSRRGWQWHDTGEIIMSPKQGWQGAARALQLSVNCHYHRAWYTAWGGREREMERQREPNGKRKGRLQRGHIQN